MPRLPIPSGLRTAGAAGGRWVVWFRLLALAEVALAMKRHLDLLEPGEPRELAELVRKSRGRPSNLTPRERRRLGQIAGKLEPTELGREVAAAFTGARRRPPGPGPGPGPGAR